MSEHLKRSIDELRSKLSAQEKEVTDTKKAINLLYRMMGDSEPYQLDDDDGHEKSLRPDTFFGKGLATAVGDYLRMLGHASSVSDIMSGLARGGYDWGDAKFPERVLRINLAKNTAKFVQIKGSDSFGLREWYPNLRAEKNGDSQTASSELDKLMSEPLKNDEEHE